MRKRILVGLVLLGTLGLSSGCLRPYYGYPARVAAQRHPGAFWTGVGLAAGGQAALNCAARQSDPRAALAAAAVGAGLYLASGGCLSYAACDDPGGRYGRAAPRRVYSGRWRHHTRSYGSR